MKLGEESGLGTVEAIVAITILVLVGSATLESIAEATRARARSRRLMQATEQALSAVEQVRCGDLDIPGGEAGFRTEVSVAPLTQQPGLSSFTVAVTWEQDGTHKVELRGLAWRSP
jgi:type II secretory pathway pseudopilin PulG